MELLDRQRHKTTIYITAGFTLGFMALLTCFSLFREKKKAARPSAARTQEKHVGLLCCSGCEPIKSASHAAAAVLCAMESFIEKGDWNGSNFIIFDSLVLT